MEKILRAPKRKLSAHMESTEEKTFFTYGKHQNLGNIEQILKSKDITGPFKLHG